MSIQSKSFDPAIHGAYAHQAAVNITLASNSIYQAMELLRLMPDAGLVVTELNMCLVNLNEQSDVIRSQEIRTSGNICSEDNQEFV